MKRIITKMHLGLLASLAIFTISCEREKLSDVMVNENKPTVSLAMESKIEVAGGNNFTLDNNQLTVPVSINFTGASTKAFTVQISADLAAIDPLIASGQLGPNAVALTSGNFTFSPVVNVPYGVQSVKWDLLISRTFLEKNYGKDIALMVKMSDAAKGNSITEGKATTLIVVKTGQTIAPEAVHYITFGETGNVNIPRSTLQPGYSMGSQDMTIDVALALSGEAGPQFTVEAAKSMETVNAAIANGTLTNTIALDAVNWSIPNPKVTVEAGKNSGVLSVNIRTSSFVFYTGKKVAIALTLKNPSKYQLGNTKTTQIVLIDPDHFRKPFNGTPFLIKGTIGVASDFIPASNYDFGGARVAYFDNGGRDGGQFRRPDEVDISGDNIVVGWTGDDEWLSYTVDVEAEGDYEFNALIGAPGDDGRYSVFFGYDNVTGILASKKTPGSYGDQQPNLSMVHLKKGVQVMRFYMNRGAYDVRGYILTRKN